MLTDRAPRAAAKIKAQRAAAKIKEGTGRPIRPFRWWQAFSRALFTLTLTVDGRRVVHAIDVPYWQRVVTSDGKGTAHLYVDGRHHAKSPLPAAFPVPGGTIEVVSTSFGLRRCRYLTPDGTIHPLVPDEHSAEGRRARFARSHPGWSRALALVSLTLVIIPVLLVVPQVVDVLSQVPPITERFGTFDSPVELPLWLNVLLGLCTSTASVERATRLRWNRMLDGNG